MPASLEALGSASTFRRLDEVKQWLVVVRPGNPRLVAAMFALTRGYLIVHSAVGTHLELERE
jgi:hypothetical protein